ncbi:CST complex subunit Ten1 [Phaeosphaeria sp. MPI-PUGE-AT-0046c]|nr:CST complex subunit Ten1 [Phaeosphaeria sp. MPI-PUGE-AT-0046c]
MSGPVPSNLVLLSDLGQCEPGMKVRFLGCVDDYVVHTATVRLKHAHPTSSPSVVANVNVDHVLETLKYRTLDVGTWLNVIGYVDRRKEKGVFVQAVTVWDAGDVDVEGYERAVEKRKEVT